MLAANETNPSFIVAEQDRSELPALEAVTISRNYMREALNVLAASHISLLPPTPSPPPPACGW